MLKIRIQSNPGQSTGIQSYDRSSGVDYLSLFVFWHRISIRTRPFQGRIVQIIHPETAMTDSRSWIGCCPETSPCNGIHDENVTTYHCHETYEASRTWYELSELLSPLCFPHLQTHRKVRCRSPESMMWLAYQRGKRDSRTHESKLGIIPYPDFCTSSTATVPMWYGIANTSKVYSEYL